MLRIAITGASGLIGTHLQENIKQYTNEKVKFYHLKRDNSDSEWFQMIESCDAIVNLAGETINQMWTEKASKRIIKSRVKTTKRIRGMLKIQGAVKRRIVIQASAVAASMTSANHRGEQNSIKHTKTFLHQVVRGWEAEARKIKKRDADLTILRFGLVLSNSGGVLPALKTANSKGLCFIMGRGKQPMPIVHIDDVCRAIIHCINERVKGRYYVISPRDPDNRVFMNLLASVLNRRFINIYVPDFILKMLLGKRSYILLNGEIIDEKRKKIPNFTYQFQGTSEILSNLIAMKK